MTFIPLAKYRDFNEGVINRCKTRGFDVLLIQSQSQLYIIDNQCPHDGSPLAKGTVSNGCIRCPRHKIAFELSTGRAQGGEVTSDLAPLKFYTPVMVDDQIGFNLP